MSDDREVLEADVLFVGGGPACLAGAYHLSRLVAEYNEKHSNERLEPMIVLIDKAGEIGAHGFSGAVMDPIALSELIPDFMDKGCPVENTVTSDSVYYLRERTSFKIPFLPPSMSNRGKLIISLARFCRWMAGLVEAQGVNIFPGFAATDIIKKNGAVRGVRTGDKGIGAAANRKSNFESGIDLQAGVTVFGDGPRGYLSKQLINEENLLTGKSIQVFETGVKTVFEMPEGSVEEGRVIHTLGYPLRSDCVGGSFIYNMANNLLALGLVVPLDYRDPFLNPHQLLQKLKLHPFIKGLVGDGKSVYYGAKTISAGGYYSMPQLYTNGALIAGEAASMIDMKHLKGIHLALKSGILAAETIFDALLKKDFSAETLKPFQDKVENSYIASSLKKSRNFHRALSLGLPRAFWHLGLQQASAGGDILSYDGIEEDYKTMQSVVEYHGSDMEVPQELASDGHFILDKLSDVYNSGTMHIEDQPPHLKILDRAVCLETCLKKYKYPCNRFCPANVYEMVKSDEGSWNLQVNFTNCVHCQTCDIKCPLDNIRWTPPEGGGGPNYTVT